MFVDEAKELIAKAISDHEERCHRCRGKLKIVPIQQPYAGNLDMARKAWPGKKRGLETEWLNFVSHHPNYQQLLDDDGLFLCVRKLIDDNAYSKGFWPNFQTFINNNRWEEALQ